MSAVLQFPSNVRREQMAATETAQLAGLRGYGLCATQQFQREAAKLARDTDLTPTTIAHRCVPPKAWTLGDNTPPSAA